MAEECAALCWDTDQPQREAGVKDAPRGQCEQRTVYPWIRCPGVDPASVTRKTGVFPTAEVKLTAVILVCANANGLTPTQAIRLLALAVMSRFVESAREYRNFLFCVDLGKRILILNLLSQNVTAAVDLFQILLAQPTPTYAYLTYMPLPIALNRIPAHNQSPKVQEYQLIIHTAAGLSYEAV